MFEGSCVALVTPFSKGRVDEKKLRDLVEFHIAEGTQAIVPCGTTGESATLSHREHGRVIEVVVRAARKRIQVIAGTGSNSTREAVEMTRHAKSVGADACLLITPYYNKPTQTGLVHHFRTVARSVSVPIVLYNVPSRTGVNMLPATVIELARSEKNIVGIKEASGNLDQSSEIRKALPKDFSLYSGDDSLTLPILSLGGQGVISVVANIIPRDVAEMCDAWRSGDTDRARELHLKMFPLFKAVFIETNPIPVKTAMGRMRLCSSELRLPLVAMSAENRKKLESALRNYGVLK
ncbi:MAG TPA: 4-hydroxy-tetrahydrodipicolinate synthase [Elusimicrobiota bacterium]|nr:4-hydroxy-tetrahydrodipicolinate synthase [Elusimicrobiota bacterium]